MKKGLLRGAAAAIAFAIGALGLAVAPAAQADAAGFGDCAAGRFCAWTNTTATGPRLQTRTDTPWLGSYDNRIRSFTNRTDMIACLYSGRNYVVESGPTGSWSAVRPHASGTGYSGAGHLDKSSLKFVRTARECVLPAFPFWYDEAGTRAAGFGDLNGDRRSDVLVRDETGALWFVSGTGDAWLAGTSGWNGMDAITRHGDHSGDGREDLIARERSTGKLWLYPGTGDGDFLPRRVIGSTGWNTMSLITAVGDLTGDRRGDLIARETATGKLWLYPGTASGGLGVRRLIGGSGWGAMNLLSGPGDLNRDGRPDLLAREAATGKLWLYPGGTSALAPRRLIGSGWNPMSSVIANGDVTGDGLLDIASVTTGGTLLIHPGRGDGTLSPGYVVDPNWWGLKGAF
ncbi:FG-GAP-like repeat-containing protein [Streptomyces bambusae]|uniref:FG-GAP-like repeat-containing protein n=1 Tax=Streptomyces bambusae TaxID=1550616 RepID=UPI001CFD740D|nr:FG-GAP-like repeat-containing protein [Streptomyces bambusae]MCB5168517.1 FG-GAP-like repeat-containing protein [Streptomyces bambusae]